MPTNLKHFELEEPKPILNDYVRNYLQIRQAADSVLSQLTGKAREYFYNSHEVSFTFMRSELQKIISLLENAHLDVNAFRVYYGASQSGDPTLIVIPAYLNGTTVFNRINTINDPVTGVPHVGIEYPKGSPTVWDHTNFDLAND